ncbi:uncharacterized protein ANIA_04879 [Aspergillus nidulans FGSC A4]|uniref:Uncharacterized protein n=1 Tax=Emericella nidulans (strain FGSC A4 / ATCC 38163 / CBS 112.46 / NRRL 194 / M139) TaxID=227321 RepID=C8V9U1_EMENI|nr:hypothetical protein [Aspergillus nidulans FGSC A4]CBF76567.1 TPA: hypothetical protein ANIA_04879 [Aspergillus nidulans FGSC A4]
MTRSMLTGPVLRKVPSLLPVRLLLSPLRRPFVDLLDLPPLEALPLPRSLRQPLRLTLLAHRLVPQLCSLPPHPNLLEPMAPHLRSLLRLKLPLVPLKDRPLLRSRLARLPLALPLLPTALRLLVQLQSPQPRRMRQLPMPGLPKGE